MRNIPPPPPPIIRQTPSSSIQSRINALQQQTNKPSSLKKKPSGENLIIDSDEVERVLHEWNGRLKKFLIDREFERFNKLKLLIDALKSSPNKLESLLIESEQILNPNSNPNTNDNDSNSIKAHVEDKDINILTEFNEKKKRKTKRKSILKQQRNHIFFDLKACIASICSVGEQTELSFSIYNKSTEQMVTEAFVVNLTCNGMPTDEDAIGRLYTIFTDLSKQDLQSELYLLCKIVRLGKMNDDLFQSSSNQPSSNQQQNQNHQNTGGNKEKQCLWFRRPFGYAILDLQPIILAMDGEKEHLMKIYTCAEQQFHNLYENIIAKNGQYETSSRAEMICISLEVLLGDIEEILQSKFKKFKVPLTECIQSNGLDTVMGTDEDRNSVYVTLVCGDFVQGRKSSARNIEAVLEVRLGDGQTLPNAISTGTTQPHVDQFHSLVYYHQNSPRWNEMVRCDVPVSNFDRGTHLFITLRHCSSSGDKGSSEDKSFAFCVLPLMNGDETVLANGVYQIQKVYKYDKKLINNLQYLTLLTGEDQQLFQQQIKDKLEVKIFLSSTKLTQSVSLLKLLRWNQLSLDDLKEVLREFTFIESREIVKYLQRILQCLFEILYQLPQIQNLTFQTLIFVLEILSRLNKGEEKVKVDNDLDCWLQLLQSMRYLVVNARDPMLGKDLRSSLKSYPILFRLVVKTFQQSQGNRSVFVEEIHQIFREIEAKIFCDSELFGAQLLILQSLFQVISELVNVRDLISADQLMQWLSRLSQPNKSDQKRLAAEKCNLLIKCMDNNLVDNIQMLKQLVCDCLKAYPHETTSPLVNTFLTNFPLFFDAELFLLVQNRLLAVDKNNLELCVLFLELLNRCPNEQCLTEDTLTLVNDLIEIPELSREKDLILLKFYRQTIDKLLVSDLIKSCVKLILQSDGGYSGEFCDLLSDLWMKLPDKNTQSLVGPLVELTFTQTYRRKAIEILSEMLRQVNPKLSEVQVEFIEQLDNFLNRHTQKKEYCDWLLTSLKVEGYLKQCLNKFCQLLNGESDSDEEKLSDLIDFTSILGRLQIHVKYIHQLAMIHWKNNQFAESAHCLLKHYKLLQWGDDCLIESEFVSFVSDESIKHLIDGYNKESLLLVIIELFQKSLYFETALECCRELIGYYEQELFDYEKVSVGYKLMATLSEKLKIISRIFPHFYLVTFDYQKRFIYRSELSIGEFIDDLIHKYPHHELIKHQSSGDVGGTHRKTIQVVKVNLIINEKYMHLKQNPRVPENIQHWFRQNDSNLFSYSRIITNSNSLVETEQLQLTTEHSFPCHLLRSPVVSTKSIIKSPIENAIDTIKQKSFELETLFYKYSNAKNNITVNPLTMSLNGAVDAPVNGGLPLYKKVFFSPQYLVDNPNMIHQVKELKQSIKEQSEIIKKCLQLHGEIVTPEMLPLHDEICKFFALNFANNNEPDECVSR